MDKELLRVMIILLGMLVMIGMLLWHFVKSMRERREAEEYDEAAYEGGVRETDVDDEEEYDDNASFSAHTPVDGDALLDEYAIRPVHRPAAARTEQRESLKPATQNFELPKLIEFSLVARADQGFNGRLLYDAFARVGLTYGSVKVFERVDKNRLVDYAVASMIEPGTFPDTDLENFYCPGIVFYMQPRALDKPLQVFDDFIETIDILAEELDGVVWDNQRQPLTAETIAQFRQMMLV
ncbi:MAG: cell division protein ZipA C-terminal FtsZ-binding domain-containing protein [Methylococcales bacterium]|nr:cell division protein ZipA C-terminal FtsZ-binding domain-containing protein [Methylococcales bacterium]